MATVKRFEELVVWQLAEVQCDWFQQLAEEGKIAQYPALKDQMDRSSGSVMDNIAEGFDRSSKADFRHFLVIARGSNAEFGSQLYRAHKRKIITPEQLDTMKRHNEILGVKPHHFISYLTASSFRQKPPAKDLSTGNDSVTSEPEVDYPSPHNYPAQLLQ